MIIGHFDYDSSSDCFKGDVVCLNFQLQNVELTPSRGQSQRQPDYAITVATLRGSVDLGSAWRRASERGTPYLSVALDSPLLVQPLNAALFMNAEGSNAVLIWTRQRLRTAPALVA